MITRTLGIAALSLALTLTGCAESSSEHSDTDHDHSHADHDHSHDGHDHAHDHAGESGTSAEETHTDVYTDILGEIVALPEGPRVHPMIHHVHIPDFKRKDGTVNMTPDGISGMRSMEMEFPLADGLSLEGYEAGDKIRFTFEVNWGNMSRPWEMTKIEKLDPSTEIDFSNTVTEAADAP